MTLYIFNLQHDNPGSFDLSAELCFRRLSISGKIVLDRVKNKKNKLEKSALDCNNPVQLAASGKKIKTFLGRISIAVMSVTAKHNA